MTHIIFDMEWNMGYPKEGQEHFDEIIEIGAVKLEDNAITGQYKSYVRPTVHRAIHHHVRKMLPFTRQELQKAQPFRQVIEEFKAWCGPDARLVSWGNSDISVLQSNLARYHLAPDWVGPVYDLQAAYAYLLGEYTHQYSLKDTVEQFQISAPEEFHDAANDAYYTALVAVEIQKRWPQLPTMEEIDAKREELRQERAEFLSQKAKKMEFSALAEAEVLAQSTLTGLPAPEKWPAAPQAAGCLCPKCARTIRSTGWSPFADGQLTRCRCPEHGWIYVFVQLNAEDDHWRAVRSIYPPTSKLKGAYFRFGHSKNAKQAARAGKQTR